MKCLFMYTFLLNAIIMQGQETFTLRGKVYDFKTRTELPGATVQLMRTDSTVVTTTTAIEHWQDGDRKGETSDFMLTVPKKETTYYCCPVKLLQRK